MSFDLLDEVKVYKISFKKGSQIESICMNEPNKPDFIMVGGAITTQKRFENFDESLAHYYSDENAISYYGNIIGTGEDLIIGEEI